VSPIIADGGWNISLSLHYERLYQPQQGDPMKKLYVVLLLFSLLSILIVACGGSSTDSDSTNTVHSNDLIFLKDQMTIKKGESITVINDSAVLHVIANGTWKDGIQEALKEPGAPAGLTIQGNETKIIGPFNTTGVFHLYCTIHPNMNLTVTVQ
jgi:plastocyanin